MQPAASNKHSERDAYVRVGHTHRGAVCVFLIAMNVVESCSAPTMSRKKRAEREDDEASDESRDEQRRNVKPRLSAREEMQLKLLASIPALNQPPRDPRGRRRALCVSSAELASGLASLVDSHTTVSAADDDKIASHHTDEENEAAPAAAEAGTPPTNLDFRDDGAACSAGQSASVAAILAANNSSLDSALGSDAEIEIDDRDDVSLMRRSGERTKEQC